MKGFTIIEILTVLGITVMIGLIAVLALSGFRAQNAFLIIQELRADLRDVQQRSVSQYQGQQWGIHIDASGGFYQTFYGSSYSAGTVVKTAYLPAGVQFLSPAPGSAIDIIFDRVTGNVPINYTVVIALIEDSGISRSISVSASGLIN